MLRAAVIFTLLSFSVRQGLIAQGTGSLSRTAAGDDGKLLVD